MINKFCNLPGEIYRLNYPFIANFTLQGTIMNHTNILMPLFKTIDKVFFGIDDLNKIEKKSELIESDNEEEFDVERSTN